MSKDKKSEKKQTKKENKEEAPFVLPPLDFSSIVLPFFSQALLTLGQIKDDEEKKEPHLDLAKRMIDLLELLKERTKGNLKPEEEQFIDASLHQLKLVYMEKAKIITL
jgi:beta-phosphoglucomutase-like phosphatase (HAD superfamily)